MFLLETYHFRNKTCNWGQVVLRKLKQESGADGKHGMIWASWLQTMKKVLSQVLFTCIIIKCNFLFSKIDARTHTSLMKWFYPPCWAGPDARNWTIICRFYKGIQLRFRWIDLTLCFLMNQILFGLFFSQVLKNTTCCDDCGESRQSQAWSQISSLTYFYLNTYSFGFNKPM